MRNTGTFSIILNIKIFPSTTLRGLRRALTGAGEGGRCDTYMDDGEGAGMAVRLQTVGQRRDGARVGSENKTCLKIQVPKHE